VEVLNGTVDFTAILTQQNKPNFYMIVEDTLDRVIPNEVTFLQNYDAFKRYLDNTYEMPDTMVALLVRF
jgi:hypothetical protein